MTQVKIIISKGYLVPIAYLSVIVKLILKAGGADLNWISLA
jgi:hypothetical protein